MGKKIFSGIWLNSIASTKVFSSVVCLMLVVVDVYSQIPTEVPRIESHEFEVSGHFEKYGKFYVYGGLILLALAIIVYIFRLDKKIIRRFFKKRNGDGQN